LPIPGHGAASFNMCFSSILVKEDSSDNDFKYDYSFLRRLGLVFAGVLFIMGILVMSCGRSCRMPKCRMKKETGELISLHCLFSSNLWRVDSPLR
uniref:FXYD domain-containing ion transport regulator n=1 Tax=Lepisosteus oculatus TaxID=7918 RepID=W5M8A3_LEPOC